MLPFKILKSQSGFYNNADFLDFGIVENDPGLQSDKVLLINERGQKEKQQLYVNQVATLNKDCQDSSLYQLPKGIMEFNPDKTKAIAISIIEDSDRFLLPALHALKIIFSKKNLFSDYRIFVLWSTSIEDCLKTVRLALDKTKDIRFLFLNDLNFNQGTGPNYTPCDLSYISNIGLELPQMIKETFAIAVPHCAVLQQTSARRQWLQDPDINPNPETWANLTKPEQELFVSKLTSYFKQGEIVSVSKLALGLDFPKANFMAIDLVLKAFKDFI